MKTTMMKVIMMTITMMMVVVVIMMMMTYRTSVAWYTPSYLYKLYCIGHVTILYITSSTNNLLL